MAEYVCAIDDEDGGQEEKADVDTGEDASSAVLTLAAVGPAAARLLQAFPSVCPLHFQPPRPVRHNIRHIPRALTILGRPPAFFGRHAWSTTTPSSAMITGLQTTTTRSKSSDYLDGQRYIFLCRKPGYICLYYLLFIDTCRIPCQWMRAAIMSAYTLARALRVSLDSVLILLDESWVSPIGSFGTG